MAEPAELPLPPVPLVPGVVATLVGSACASMGLQVPAQKQGHWLEHSAVLARFALYLCRWLAAKKMHPGGAKSCWLAPTVMWPLPSTNEMLTSVCMSRHACSSRIAVQAPRVASAPEHVPLETSENAEQPAAAVAQGASCADTPAVSAAMAVRRAICMVFGVTLMTNNRLGVELDAVAEV